MCDTSAGVTPATLYWKLGTVVVVVPIVVEVVVDVEVVVEVELDVEVVVRWRFCGEALAALDRSTWADVVAPQAVITNTLAASVARNQPVRSRPGER